MKLADKPLALKQTLGEVIDSLRANGLVEDADQLQKQVQQIASFTNWTQADLRGLDFAEWPKLASRFAELMTGESKTAINPTTVTASAPTVQG